MPVLKAQEAQVSTVKEGITRRLIHTDTLMTVVIDFEKGPWKQPDPPHSHVHEQTTYVAAGEIIFFCEGEPEQILKAGDMFAVPSGKSHTIQLLSATARLVDSFTPLREEFLKS
jgi:quercetin dioxygenase-like cupin family protein